jgi:beta,beta-carotene 9',10'-dioxygenase
MRRFHLWLICSAVALCSMTPPSVELRETSLESEIVVDSLPVQGTVPFWLSGTFVRNGPAKFEVNGKRIAHRFDGLAMLHAFSFNRGVVSYANKFLRTDAYKKVYAEGSIDYDTFASDPCRSLFKRFLSFFTPAEEEPLHNANVNIAKIADKYVALTETPLPVEFDPKTLETLGVLDYADELPHKKAWESAHPHTDRLSGEIISYLIRYGITSHYEIYRIQKDSATRELIASIPVKEPAYMHSFSVTENYIILTEYPFVVKPVDLLLGKKQFIQNFVWHPERGVRFLIIDRKEGKLVHTAFAPSFFSFHHANAYENREGHLLLDLVAYKDPSIIQIAGDFSEKDWPERTLMRYHLSFDEETVREESLSDGLIGLEFPRLNEACDGKPYTYLYGLNSENQSLVKIDLETKAVMTWLEKDCYPSEPVFVASSDAQEEDEGVILSIILDQERGNSFLLVLDAKTFAEIARAYVPHHIPSGLHGQYFSAAAAL